MIKIIIADDHKTIRTCFTALFKILTDCEVVAEASNGKEAIDLARFHKPDIILMDYSMPELTGVEATKILKHEMPDIKVIGLSMHSEDSYIKEFLNAGADTYLLKDCGIDEIQNTIREVLENSNV